jgi:hypothetical protein
LHSRSSGYPVQFGQHSRKSHQVIKLKDLMNNLKKILSIIFASGCPKTVCRWCL